MSSLISNMPAEEVWVRKEYLTDFKSGHGEFTPGVWVSVKSMPGRAFYFETYLPEYAAIYDNSLTPKNPKMPDFKVSTRVFSVERGHMERYGDTDDYHYGLRETVNGDDEEDLLSVGG